MNMLQKIRFSIMLQLGIFKTKRGKTANTAQVDLDGKVLVWGYTPEIKTIQELDDIYETNKAEIDGYREKK